VTVDSTTDPLNDERLTHTKLEDLVWDEISGVTAGAAKLDGWVLRKDRAPGPGLTLREALRKEVAPIREAISVLNARLDQVERGRS
jgi:hypothetical protein